MISKIEKIIKEQIKKIIMEEENFINISPVDTKSIEDIFNKTNINTIYSKLYFKDLLKDEKLADWVVENLKNFEEYKNKKFNISDYYQFYSFREINQWNKNYERLKSWGLNPRNKILSMKFSPKFLEFLKICQNTFNSTTFRQQQFLNLNASKVRELDKSADEFIINPIRTFLELINYNVLVKNRFNQKLNIFNFNENQKMFSENDWRQNVLKIKEKIKDINFTEIKSTYSYIGNKDRYTTEQKFKIGDSIEGYEFKFLDVPIKFDKNLFPIKKVMTTSNIINQETIISDINRIAEYGPIDSLNEFASENNRSKNSFALSLILMLSCLDPKKNVALVYRYNNKIYLINNFNSSKVDWEYNPEKNFKPW